MSVRVGCLLGPQHCRLGAIDTIAEGPVAIGISRGGANKLYDHVDPNEDAALWVSGAGGSLLAVADGHGGAHGAQAAIEELAELIAPGACASEAPARSEHEWTEWLYRALQTSNAAMARDATTRQLAAAPSTVCLAVIRPAEQLWAWAGVGDSHIFSFDGSSAVDVGWKGHDGRRTRAHFLGDAEESWHRANTALGSASLTGVDAIVLATDGLSEHGIGLDEPAAAVARAARSAGDIEAARRAQWLAREITEQANRSHRRQKSGDNIATAVWTRGANA